MKRPLRRWSCLVCQSPLVAGQQVLGIPGTLAGQPVTGGARRLQRAAPLHGTGIGADAPGAQVTAVGGHLLE